jgi:hypothetical protein
MLDDPEYFRQVFMFLNLLPRCFFPVEGIPAGVIAKAFIRPTKQYLTAIFTVPSSELAGLIMVHLIL